VKTWHPRREGDINGNHINEQPGKYPVVKSRQFVRSPPSKRKQWRQPRTSPEPPAAGAVNRRDQEQLPVRFCSYCGKKNHVPENCWLAMKACLICGEGHPMVDCPRYSANRENQRKNLNWQASQPRGQQRGTTFSPQQS